MRVDDGTLGETDISDQVRRFDSIGRWNVEKNGEVTIDQVDDSSLGVLLSENDRVQSSVFDDANEKLLLLKPAPPIDKNVKQATVEKTIGNLNPDDVISVPVDDVRVVPTENTTHSVPTSTKNPTNMSRGNQATLNTVVEDNTHQKSQVLHCTYDANLYCTRHKRKGVPRIVIVKERRRIEGGEGFETVSVKRKIRRCPDKGRKIKPNISPAGAVLQNWLRGSPVKTKRIATQGIAVGRGISVNVIGLENIGGAKQTGNAGKQTTGA